MKKWPIILICASIAIISFTGGVFYEQCRFSNALDEMKNTGKKHDESLKMEDSLLKILRKQMNTIEQLEKQIKIKPDTTKSEDKTSTVLTQGSLRYYKRDIVS